MGIFNRNAIEKEIIAKLNIKIDNKKTVFNIKKLKSLEFENFGALEGPYPQMKLPKLRWGLGPKSSISLNSDKTEVLNLLIEYNNIIKNQKLNIFLNGKCVYENLLNKDKIGVLKQIRLKMNFNKGYNIIRFKYSNWKKIKGKRPIALIITKFRIYDK